MATPYPYVSGAVLTAAQLNDGQNLPINDVTANYVLVNNDRYKRVIMNNAGSTTITVNNNVFVAGDIIWCYNKGAGSTVITAGAGVTVNTAGSLTLAQYGGGYLLALSASTFTFFSGGAPAYGTATGGIGSPTSVTISGVNYQYLTFNATGTLTVTRAGFFDYCAVGGGGGNGHTSTGGGGGGSGVLLIGSVYLDANQTITIGGGSATADYRNIHSAGDTIIAATSPFSVTAGGNVSANTSTNNFPTVGGGMGCNNNLTARAITQAYGKIGGSSVSEGGGGGGFTGAGGNSTTTVGGAGGAGFDVSVFIGGSELRKAMGGGGGAPTTGGAAATGGVGGSNNTTPSNGNANSGGGGGGGYGVTTTGNGGSGICYIRWKVS